MDVNKMMANKAQQKGIILKMLELTFEKIQFLVDVPRIEQVMVNLLSNAIKFSEAHSVITVTLKLKKDLKHKNYLEFKVVDKGIGIEKEDIDNVFLPFFQLMKNDKDSKKVHLGCGLGLSICKNIIERLGGTILIESVPGEGSTFTV